MTQTVLIVVVGPVAVLMMPLMFLLAGLLTAPSLARKGPAAYARDRLLRLGVPFAAFVLLLWPLLMYPIHPPGQAPRWEFLGSDPPSINTGPLWFVGVLLIFSLVYTGWVRVRRGHGGGRPHGEVRARHLLLLAGAAIVATFLVRLVVPLGGTHIGLNLWEWPACATLFGLGITGFAKGWLTAVPDRLCRRCRAVTLAALVGFAMFAVFGAARARGVVTDQRQWGGGWHWLALVFAALECTLAVFGSVWLLGGAQRHLDRAVRWAGPAVGRSAFAAFVLQGLVLIGLAVALRPFPLPAEVKALLVAVGGVAGSFALAWLLISRVPVVARIL